MEIKDKFLQAGFNVMKTETNENRLLAFLKENYPQVIRDGEINVSELKTATGLPVDEKTNGYGLNFIGRNAAKAKYEQKTAKELKINSFLSKKFDTTQNIVLKGDNLDCMKILKNYYAGAIKCIYIDPPYNTNSDEFVYPDKFDAEEREVLGLTNLNENDLARMEFAFGSKKSHNGWLAFMYPRLMLARDLLSRDGVIFISIDDNEQANLKLLCDEIFGEENLIYQLSVVDKLNGNDNSSGMMETQEFCLIYAKSKNNFDMGVLPIEDDTNDWQIDKIGFWKEGGGIKATGVASRREDRPNLFYPLYINEDTLEFSLEKNDYFTYELLPKIDGTDGRWTWAKEKFVKDANEVIIKKVKDGYSVYKKQRPALGDLPSKRGKTTFYHSSYSTANSSAEIKAMFDGKKVFPFSKSTYLIKDFISLANIKQNEFILDFFAGSGTTGHAVMQLNADDGGSRKFILCQIDEPIDPKKKKEAFDFCVNNNLPPVISSITAERLKRAGDKIVGATLSVANNGGLFKDEQLKIPDVGFKVFDTIDAPKLAIEDGQIVFQNMENDSLSRIYNMIFSIGIDEPNSKLECLVENCMYKIDNHYYITHAENLDKTENKEYLSNAIKEGKVFIDGWTASINTTLQNYKEDVKIVF